MQCALACVSLVSAICLRQDHYSFRNLLGIVYRKVVKNEVKLKRCKLFALLLTLMGVGWVGPHQLQNLFSKAQTVSA